MTPYSALDFETTNSALMKYDVVKCDDYHTLVREPLDTYTEFCGMLYVPLKRQIILELYDTKISI